MSPHWRLTLWYTVWVASGALLAVTLVWSRYGGEYAGALAYGAGVGLLSFVSTALSVSLLTGGSKVWRAVGAASFAARYGVVAIALGAPAYLELWPAVAMMAGVSGVYLAENVVLLPGVIKLTGSAERGRRAGTENTTKNVESVERRVAV